MMTAATGDDALVNAPTDGTEVGKDMAWLNGELVREDDAHVAASTRGLLLGEGLFETMLSVHGRVRFLEHHLARLQESCERLGLALPWSSDHLAEAVADVIRHAGRSASEHPQREATEPDTAAAAYLGAHANVMRVRLTVAGGSGTAGLVDSDATPHVLITATPFTPDPTPIAAITLPWRRNENSPVTGMKATSMIENVAAMTHIRGRGALEGLWLNTRDELCEGTMTNLFVEVDGLIRTPPVSSGCLPGIARAAVIRSAPTLGIEVQETVMTTAMLDRIRAGSASAFLTNALRGVIPVNSLDEHPVAIGPLTAMLARNFNDLSAINTD